MTAKDETEMPDTAEGLFKFFNAWFGKTDSRLDAIETRVGKDPEKDPDPDDKSPDPKHPFASKKLWGG